MRRIMGRCRHRHDIYLLGSPRDRFKTFIPAISETRLVIHNLLPVNQQAVLFLRMPAWAQLTAKHSFMRSFTEKKIVHH